MARPSMDPEDVASLCRAKEASQKRRSELALPGGSWHCRRRTRGLEETTRSIGSLIDLFDSSDGKDTLEVPLLDHERIQQIWKEQWKHIQRIQDPEDFPLYMKTGTLRKGGVELCCYRCTCGSTSTSTILFQVLHTYEILIVTLINAVYKLVILL